MARVVIWRPEARADLWEINAYITVRSPSGARRVVERIRDATGNCRHFPYSNRMISEFHDPERRETFVYDYRVMDRVESRCIRMLRVVHGQRLLKNVPGSFEEAPHDTSRAMREYDMGDAVNTSAPCRTAGAWAASSIQIIRCDMRPGA